MAVCAHKSFKNDGQTGGEGEDAGVGGQHLLLVCLVLAAEQSVARAAHHAALDAVGFQEFGGVDERAHFRAAGQEDNVEVFSVLYDIGTLASLRVIHVAGQ